MVKLSDKESQKRSKYSVEVTDNKGDLIDRNGGASYTEYDPSDSTYENEAGRQNHIWKYVVSICVVHVKLNLA